MKPALKMLSIIIALALLLSLGSRLLFMNSGSEATASIIVRFKNGTSYANMTQVNSITGGKIENAIPEIGAYVIEVPASEVFARASQYRADSRVNSVEIDSTATVSSIPDDPDFSQEWGMVKVQAPQTWDITKGSPDIKIAIVDTGIDLNHPDLASKIVVSKNFGTSSTASDLYGHGTHVAGITAAISNNGLGMTGMGYNSSLMNVKVSDDRGGANYSWIAQGIIWASDNGASVINVSLGGGESSETLRQAIDYAWNKGAVIVVAAGNSGSSTPSYPAYYDNAIAVAATDPDDHLYSMSNYGSWVDVAAPGSALSTLPGGNYGFMTGTSMAAPLVSGLAALAFTLARDTNGNGRLNDEVRAMIENNCDNIGISGIGKGRINAYRTLSALAPPTGSITGPVTDAFSAKPIVGAFISDGKNSFSTTSSGNYTIADILPGTYTLTASASGYQSSSRTVTVSTGQTVLAGFSLQKIPSGPTVWVDGISFIPTTTGLLLKVKIVNPQPVDGAWMVVSLSHNNVINYDYGPTNAYGERYWFIKDISGGTYTATILSLWNGYTWDKNKGVISVTYSPVGWFR